MNTSPPISESSDIRNLTGQIDLAEKWPSAHGGFADVWTGFWTRSNEDLASSRNLKVAVKVLRVMISDGETKKKMNQRLRRELRIWQRLFHNNVLRLCGVTFDYGPYPSMVCPWQENGNLNQYLEHRGTTLSLLHRFQLLCHIAAGLSYLHSCSVVHGDLTGSNVLIDEAGDACLSDFGLSSVAAEVQASSYLTSSVGGALRWADPALYPDFEEGHHVPSVSTYSDVYSFGSLVLQVLSGRVPYYDFTNMQVLFQLTRGLKPQRPPELWASDIHWGLIQECWVDPPDKRLDATQAKQRVENFFRTYQSEVLPVPEKLSDASEHCSVIPSPPEIANTGTPNLLSLNPNEQFPDFFEPFFRIAAPHPSSINNETDMSVAFSPLPERGNEHYISKFDFIGSPPSPLSRNEITSSVDRERARKAWNQLMWTTESTIPRLDGGTWDLCGGILAQSVSDAEDSLLFSQLPSNGRSVKHWKVDIGFYIADFAFDPSQDLLVVIEEVEIMDNFFPRIHLRALSTGSLYPSIFLPTLSYTPTGFNEQWSYNIIISGSHLGILFRSTMIDDGRRNSELVFWNWKIGSIELHLFGLQIDSFSFLTTHHVVVATREVAVPFSNNPSLEIFDLRDPCNERMHICNAERLCSFNLPYVTSQTFEMTLHTDPPLSFDDDHRTKLLIIVIRIPRSINQQAKPQSVFFVPVTTLKTHMQHIKDGDVYAPVFSWKVWGPRGSRMLMLHTSQIWNAFVDGMRFIKAISRGHGFFEGIQLFDFDPESLQVDLPEESDNSTQFILNETSVGIEETIFAEPVATSLPYRVRTAALPNLFGFNRIKAALLSAENIILILWDNENYGILTF